VTWAAIWKPERSHLTYLDRWLETFLGSLRKKRLLAAMAGSTALMADAAESAVCDCLAWITLAGCLPKRSGT
jgi:hypothetical protein